jgi:TfoX N-terminal domain
MVMISGGAIWDAPGMAYDDDLADRIRQRVGGEAGLAEKRMFGGLAFLINGHMAVSVSGQGGLLLRVEPARTEALAAEPGAGRFVMRGREMTGWLRVEADEDTADDELDRWIAHGVSYVRSLPPK